MGISDLLFGRSRATATPEHALRTALVEGPPAPARLEIAPRRAPAAPAVNVAAVVSEAIDGASLPAHVSVVRSRARHAAFAATDAVGLRDGLRALLQAAAETMPAGGELRIALARQGTQLVVEVADSGVPLSGSDALDRAAELLARCGARLTRSAVPGRGNRSRVVLTPPSPPPLARAPRRPRPAPAPSPVRSPEAAQRGAADEARID